MFAKLVRQPRGGYCFEQHTLFLAVLRTLKFHVYPVAARYTTHTAAVCHTHTSTLPMVQTIKTNINTYWMHAHPAATCHSLQCSARALTTALTAMVQTFATKHDTACNDSIACVLLYYKHAYRLYCTGCTSLMQALLPCKVGSCNVFSSITISHGIRVLLATNRLSGKCNCMPRLVGMASCCIRLINRQVGGCCRVVTHTDEQDKVNHLTGTEHMCLIVSFGDGTKWLTDVGFGAQVARGPVRLDLLVMDPPSDPHTYGEICTCPPSFPSPPLHLNHAHLCLHSSPHGYKLCCH